MKKSLFLSLIISALVVTGCCKKCDLPFEVSELANLKYEFTGTRTYENGSGAEVSMLYKGREVEDSGKTCGGFGAPDLDACSTTATQDFDISGDTPDLVVTLAKFRDDTSSATLQLVISIGDTNIFIRFDANTMTPDIANRVTSMTINGVDYDDVITYFFDPNADCKQPNSANCVGNDDIVGIDFSLSAGLLRFQVHKGLQTPNEVYTLSN